MNGNEFEALLALVHRKNKFDKTNSWSKGSKTYLAELKKELVEVEDEIQAGRQPYLEEELGDVLWDYLNLLVCLNDEDQISMDKVLQRTLVKFTERLSAIEAGETWADIKEVQKRRLAIELQQSQ